MPKVQEFTPRTAVASPDIIPFLRYLGDVDGVPTWEESHVTKSDLSLALAVSQGNKLVSGGNVIWVSGYTFRVSPAIVDFNGTLVSFAQTDITLDSPDATYSRIDLIVVGKLSGIVSKITGTPSTPAVAPDYDPVSQYQLNFITVDAASSQPSTVARTWIYQDNAEWTFSGSGTVNANSTADPFAGTKAIDGTTVLNSQYFRLQAPAPFNVNGYDLLYLYIKPKAAWGTKYLRFNWETSGGARKGNFFSLSDGVLGFNASTLSYQIVAIPVSMFAVPSNTLVQALRVTAVISSGSVGFLADNIAFQVGVEQPQIVLPVATTTNRGIVELAEDGESVAGLAVQGNDSRLVLADGAVTDAKIGSRTIDDTQIPTVDAGVLTNLFSWIGNIIKGITGKSTWRTTPRTTLENAVKLNGDTMTGALVLSGAPSTGLHPATKTYADSGDTAAVVSAGSYTYAQISALSALKIAKAGDTMTGPLTLTQARFSQTAITYGATTTIDFNAEDEQTLLLTGNPTLQTSNRAAGKSKTIKIDPGASDRTITYPAWVAINAALPTTFSANKIIIMTLKCWGTAETDVIASVGAQP